MSSSQPYRLRIEMLHQSSGLWYSAEYLSFTVGDETITKYRVNVDGYSGDAGDGFHVGVYLYQDGMSFTTYDNDNDLYYANCAVRWLGGWWHNDCCPRSCGSTGLGSAKMVLVTSLLVCHALHR